jgi:hypothetical protein
VETQEMNFFDHLRQFFGDEVAQEEWNTLAIHAIAADVRRLKPAICEAVWESRQRSALTGNEKQGASRLNEARQLHSMYLAALDEFKQITEQQVPAGAVAGHDESTGRT